MASGGTDISAIDTNPVNTTYILYGAVVGGPDVNDNFFDIRSDWPQTEVCSLDSFDRDSCAELVRQGSIGLQCATSGIGGLQCHADYGGSVLHCSRRWRLCKGQAQGPTL